MKRTFTMFVIWITTCICIAKVPDGDVATIPGHTDLQLKIYGFYKLWHGVCQLQDGEHFLLEIYDRGEAVVNGQAYGKIEAQGRNDILFLARQEGQKVYRYDEETNTDVLMFDYSLNVGDEVVVDGDKRMRVMETGTVQKLIDFNNGRKALKTLKLVGEGDNPEEDIWMEGVGSVYTGILSKKQIENYRAMYMANVSLTADYTISFDIDTDFYKTLPVESFDLTNEERKELEESGLYGRNFLNFEFIDDTLHVTGVWDLNCYNYQMECSICDDKIVCRILRLSIIESWECSFYRRVEAKFPGFKDGVYQASYKGGEPVEVVKGTTYITTNTAPHQTDTPPTTFDLTGRKVPAQQTKGIYIRKGKKVMGR